MNLRAACLLALCLPVSAQDFDAHDFDSEAFDDLAFRCIGPWRGGRVTTVEGVPSVPGRYYMGAAGGGVWRTDDHGLSWRNLSDEDFGVGTIGAIAVAPSDPNVVYVGTGEAQVRGVTTSHGDGVYRSDDGGETWRHIGLTDSRYVSAVRVHPTNPELVFVAAQGELWAPNGTRGVFVSENGGGTWHHVLEVDENTGCSSLVIDPSNPRVLYAGMWQHRRTPWKVESGGEGSGIYRSVDGGMEWEQLEEGLPELMGKVGVAVSPANSSRLWAIVEAEDGGLFRSDDRGDSWRRVSADRVLRARAWYYTRVVADPRDENTVYVLNAPVLRSIDGGQSFTPISTPHGDNHALWIHPDNPDLMINGNDGGANVTTNGGRTWTDQANQPTAQFYRVITDAGFPYRVYGGQQDNSTVSIASATSGGGIQRSDWHSIGGGESAFVAFDEDDPRFVYAGVYQGILTEWDRRTRTSRNVMAVPYLGLGANADDLAYRFNWNAPVVASPHDPTRLYHAGNQVLQSTDRGRTWAPISPDLTRNDPEKQQEGGGPITNEAAGAENYNTLSYLAASPHEPGVLWAGSDDGLVHVTRNAGETWTNVTPAGVGEALVNAIEVSPHAPGTAWVAITRYKFADRAPHVFLTRNYGGTWERRVTGLPAEAYVRVVREDPEREGLCYAGTEAGLFVSLDGGRAWRSFRRNLPPVAITDLTLREGDLVVATQGRGFWILDDLSALRQLEEAHLAADLVLFAPADLRTLLGGGGGFSQGRGQNPQPGALIHYWIGEGLDQETPVSLTIRAADGDVLRTFGGEDGDELNLEPGLRRLHWDLRLDGIASIPGQFTYGSTAGPRVPPGTYEVELRQGEASARASFSYLPDPRVEHRPQAWSEQQEWARAIHAAADRVHENVNALRRTRSQLQGLQGREDFPLADEAEALISDLSAWEESVIQVKQETFQDVINFPNRLNAELLDALSKLDGNGPELTDGLRGHAHDLLSREADAQAALDALIERVAAFNATFAEQALPAVELPKR